uniref:Uncharacterized protein n=1 Tax=Megaviridae environmental sample TaxID=1737588 RepID=A0A5J6VKN8_9VIRU|nr:MAG: hypothetical protein [Megaviridae environmental sample]
MRKIISLPNGGYPNIKKLKRIEIKKEIVNSKEKRKRFYSENLNIKDLFLHTKKDFLKTNKEDLDIIETI